MNILIPLVGTFSKEGGWRVLSELANSWLRSGHRVTFLSHCRYKEPYYPTKANIVFYDNKGNIKDSGSSDFNMPLGGPFALRYLLEQALNKLEADVVLATQHFTVAPISRSKIKAKKFYYVQAYEPDFYNDGPLRYRIYKQIAINSYKKGLETIVNSPMYMNYRGIRSDKVVYPGLNLEIFHPKILRPNDGKIILGSIGRKEKFKGTSYILDAFAQLRKEFGEKIELHLAFGDEKWGELDGVKMSFPRDDYELADFYRSIDCYICTQYIQLDAVHYPIIESMACGTTVITTGYYPSNSNNSWRISVKNSQSVVEKVKEMINNPEATERKRKEALTSIKEFEWDLVGSKMINFFAE